MRKLILSLAALLALPLAAQTSKEEVLSDLNRTGGVYYAYPGPADKLTPAPKGYLPVYVSHYGRHGSRYLISDRDYTGILNQLTDARDAGALTPAGHRLLAKLDSLMLETSGRGGDLSPLGTRQHKGIAARMAAQYPEVFGAKNASMTARSTLVPRCILSMAAFCESLKEQNPTLQIDRESSNRYMPYLCYHFADHGKFTVDGKWKEQYRKFKAAHTNPDRLVGEIFSDPAYVDMNINPSDFMWSVYWLASDAQNTEGKIDFYEFFTPDELFDLWQSFNYVFYVNDGAFAGNGTMMTDNALPLIANIMESADEALLAGKPTADLRFGHDGNLIPLAAALHLTDCDLVTGKPEEFFTKFADWKVAPMAGNIQIVFFRNKKNPDDVLVKFLLNEHEVGIPVATDKFPYYAWKDVRPYLQGLIGE